MPGKKLNKITIPQFTKRKLFRGIGVTRNTVSKNIQPSYSVKVREMSAGSLRLQNDYPLSCDYFVYFYLFIYLFHPHVAAGIQPSTGTLWCK